MTVLKRETWDVVVGNPPYQFQSEDMVRSDSIYHNFMVVSKHYAKFISLVYPSRWMMGGRTSLGMEEFKAEESRSLKYRVFYDFSSSEAVFSPSVNITGGVNLFLWDRSKDNPGVVYFYNYNKDLRPTLGGGSVIRTPEAVSIVNKVNAQNSLDKIVGGVPFYGVHLRNYEKIKDLETHGSGVFCYALAPEGGVARIEIDGSTIRKDYSDYKIAVSKTAGVGDGYPYRRPRRIFIAEPNSIFTESFLKIGSFKTEAEVVNALMFLKTDFVNFLLSLLTHTQNTTKSNYKLIPLVDFSTGEILDLPGTSLDFTNPATLDKQLADIYSLDEAEQMIIRKNIRPWKDKLDLTADR